MSGVTVASGAIGQIRVIRRGDLSISLKMECPGEAGRLHRERITAASQGIV